MEVSADEVVLEGSEEEWLDWRVDAEEKVLKESENTTMGTGLPVAESSEIPRFAKRSKTRDLAHFVQDSPASQKLLTAQLVPELPASPEMLDKQLEQSAPASSSQQALKVKRERTGRTPGILETKPRVKRMKKEQEYEVVPPGFLVAYGHKMRSPLRGKVLAVAWERHQKSGTSTVSSSSLNPASTTTSANTAGGKGQFQAETLTRQRAQRMILAPLPQTREATAKRTLHRGVRVGSVIAGRLLRRSTCNNWRVNLGMPDNSGNSPVFSGMPNCQEAAPKSLHHNCRRSRGKWANKLDSRETAVTRGL